MKLCCAVYVHPQMGGRSPTTGPRLFSDCWAEGSPLLSLPPSEGNEMLPAFLHLQYQLAAHSTSLLTAAPACRPQYQLASHSISLQPAVPAYSLQHQHAVRSTSLPLGAFLFSSVSGLNGRVNQGTRWKCHSQFLTCCMLFPKDLKPARVRARLR